MDTAKRNRLAGWVHRGASLFFWIAVAGAVVIAIGSALSLGSVLFENQHSSVLLPLKVAVTPDGGIESSGGLYDSAAVVFDHGVVVAGPGSFPAWLLLMVPLWIGLVLSLSILYQLRALTATLVSGTPFVPDNARRLRLIGLILVGGQLLAIATSFALQSYARAHFTLESGSFSMVPELDVFRLLIGGLILVIAEAFRIGTQLQQERDETI